MAVLDSQIRTQIWTDICIIYLEFCQHSRDSVLTVKKSRLSQKCRRQSVDNSFSILIWGIVTVLICFNFVLVVLFLYKHMPKIQGEKW